MADNKNLSSYLFTVEIDGIETVNKYELKFLLSAISLLPLFILVNIHLHRLFPLSK